MSSHHNTTLNFSHAPYKATVGPGNIDQEIKMGEFRLRYVQLMRDAHSTPGEKAANVLIEESQSIWDKLRNKKTEED